MNYKLHYEKLIERARNRKLQGYKEEHHIIPRSMGGTDDKDNLVNLTAREHFVAHILLVKIYPKEKGLINAVNMMCRGQDERKIHNRMYGWLKERFSKRMSEINQGEANSQFGTMWISNINEKVNKKVPKGKIPEGWVKGRNAWNKADKENLKLKKIREKKEKKIKQLREYYKIYSNKGWYDFVEYFNYKYSKQNLVQQFSKFLPEFVPQNGKKR